MESVKLNMIDSTLRSTRGSTVRASMSSSTPLQFNFPNRSMSWFLECFELEYVLGF